MSANIPPAVNYSDALVGVPTRFASDAREGSKMVPVAIQWAQMGGDNYCVNINLQNNATLEFSQIVAVSVDNSNCGADIQFIFPDTGETLSIPAYSPKVVCPIFSNQTQFFVRAGLNGQIVLDGDVTNFSIHNTMPPVIAVPTTVEQSTVSAVGIAADGAGTDVLIPAGVNGTLQGIVVTRSSPITTTGYQTFKIRDGAGNDLFIGEFQGETGNVYNVTPLSLNPIHVRFSDGLNFVQTGANVGGTYAVNLLYRKP